MTAHRIGLETEADFAGWREAVRALLRADVPPQAVLWQVGDAAGDLFAADAANGAPPSDGPPARISRAALDLAAQAICHDDPERFALLHAFVRRLQDEPHLMAVATDPLVARIEAMAKAVRRDIHKMHAFVRFRSIGTEAGEHFVAWFEPSHHTVEAGAPFFRRRFAAMRWSILTPRRCAHWDRKTLAFTPGLDAPAPAQDAMEDLWRTYYAAIFNPARLKVSAMRSEMPAKYWRNLPEASLIPPLIAAASTRRDAMIAAAPAPARVNPQRRVPVPRDEAQARSAEDGDIAARRADASQCRACPLWADATQTVFGEGPQDADIVFVGEQPGDKEDLAGRPFVGPAGQLFDRALAEAGIARERTYVTNAVKHFKFEPRGKFRLHKRPGASEIDACRWWVTRELDLIRPAVTVALGATALQSLIGKATPVTASRGRVLAAADGREVFATVHPSYLLRLPDEATKQAEFARFVEDLRGAAALLARQAA